MRIEDFSQSPLKGQPVSRASGTHSAGRTVSRSGDAASDLVALSGMAALVSGSPPARIEQLRNDVAEGTYLVPSDVVSHRIVEYYLGA